MPWRRISLSLMLLWDAASARVNVEEAYTGALLPVPRVVSPGEVFHWRYEVPDAYDTTEDEVHILSYDVKCMKIEKFELLRAAVCVANDSMTTPFDLTSRSQLYSEMFEMKAQILEKAQNGLCPMRILHQNLVHVGFVDVDAFKVTLDIMAISNLRGNISPKDWVSRAEGSMLALAKTVQGFRSQGKPYLLLSTGDNIRDERFLSFAPPNSAVEEALELLGLRASVVGNQEISQFAMDSGRFRKEKFAWLGANVRKAPDVIWPDRELIEPYIIHEVAGEGGFIYRIGVIGLAHIHTLDMSIKLARERFRVDSPFEQANVWAHLLRTREGCHAIVVAIHDGADDVEMHSLSGTFGDFLSKLSSDIDLVIGGHTEVSYIWKQHRALTVLPRVVAQPEPHVQEYLLASLTFSHGRLADIGAQLHRVPQITLPWPLLGEYYTGAMEDLITKHEKLIEAMYKPAHGVAEGVLSRPGAIQQENVLARMVADALYASLLGKIPTPLTGAIVNTRIVRRGFSDGTQFVELTRRVVENVIPFDESVWICEFTTDDLQKLLSEQDKAYLSKGSGWSWHTLTPSQTIAYTYRTSLKRVPTKYSHKREISYQVLGLNLTGPTANDSVHYIAMPEFLKDGGDWFTPPEVCFRTETSVRAAFRWYVWTTAVGQTVLLPPLDQRARNILNDKSNMCNLKFYAQDVFKTRGYIEYRAALNCSALIHGTTSVWLVTGTKFSYSKTQTYNPVFKRFEPAVWQSVLQVPVHKNETIQRKIQIKLGELINHEGLSTSRFQLDGRELRPRDLEEFHVEVKNSDSFWGPLPVGLRAEYLNRTNGIETSIGLMKMLFAVCVLFLLI